MSQRCWHSIYKLQPNDCNIGFPVATCCDTLGLSNRTRVHALAQLLLEPGQTSTISYNIHKWCMKWTICKLEPTAPNRLQHIATPRNLVGQTRSICCAQQCCDILRSNVAIVWLGLAFRTGVICLRILGEQR